MSDEPSFTERAQRLDETPPEDHGIALALVALGSVPVVGGIAATAFSEYVPRRKQRRLTEFVADLAVRFDQERERIDNEFVHSQDFDRMAEDVT